MSANLGESIRLGKRVCEEDSAVTLRASDGKMGDNQPVVATRNVFDISETRSQEVVCYASPQVHDTTNGNNKEVSPTFSAAAGESGNNRPFICDTRSQELPSQGSSREQEEMIRNMRYIVRRLTPTESERLMGLPDGWTIPQNLEITDALVAEFQRVHDTYGAIMYEYAMLSYECSHREGEPPPNPPKPKSAAWVRKWLEKITNPDTCPDAPRYKGCGNGMCTNQVRWIFTRLLVSDGIDPWEAMS